MPSADRTRPRRALAAWTLAACALPACAVDLDDAPTSTPDPDVTKLASCAVLAAPPASDGAHGRVQTLVRDDGTILVVAEALVRDGSEVANAAWEVPAGAAPGACAEGLAPAPEAVVDGLDAAPLEPDAAASLLAVVAVDDEVHAFVETYRGLSALGIGLATWDAARARFVAAPGYLFAAGRPRYGDAALVDGDHVYAYGCAEAGFLAEDCFVARAPRDALADPTAWEYYRDGNDFTRDADDAWPIFGGGSGLAVGRHGRRVVAAYTTPFGDTVLVRTGLGPTGPWAPAVAVTRCELGQTGAFCGAIGLHPALVGHDDTLAVTYVARSFDPMDAADRLTRLARVPFTRVP